MTETKLAPYQPSRSLPAKLNRRLTQWRAADRLANNPGRPVVSFTFDDFPKSAADTGAEIIEQCGGRATYYACTGMAGTRTVCGDMFDERNIIELVKAGHEIGAHTATHLDCAQERIPRILNDIAHNLTQLSTMGVPGAVRQFAYPYGETSLPLKRSLRERFTAARGVLSGINGKGSDRMQLRAVEMTPDPESLKAVLNAIDVAAQQGLWLVVFTHDVSLRPSPFGVRPRHLARAARAARDAGAELLTMSEAQKMCEAREP
ncbi:MAG: polysaccharide deacetylase family protein [Pseudomonadota bacterium]